METARIDRISSNFPPLCFDSQMQMTYIVDKRVSNVVKCDAGTGVNKARIFSAWVFLRLQVGG